MIFKKRDFYILLVLLLFVGYAVYQKINNRQEQKSNAVSVTPVKNSPESERSDQSKIKAASLGISDL
ncbi:MAG: hypothetical protein AB7V25_01415 [Mangrovibacterium sp.]